MLSQKFVVNKILKRILVSLLIIICLVLNYTTNGYAENRFNSSNNLMFYDMDNNRVVCSYGYDRAVNDKTNIGIDSNNNSEENFYIQYLVRSGIISEDYLNHNFDLNEFIDSTEYYNLLIKLKDKYESECVTEVDLSNLSVNIDWSKKTNLNDSELVNEQQVEDDLYYFASIQDNKDFITYLNKYKMLDDNEDVQTKIKSDSSRNGVKKEKIFRLLSNYLMLRDKPDFVILGSETIHYIGPEGYDEGQEDINDDEECSCNDSDDDTDQNPTKWNGMSNPNAHKKITQNGINILLKEKKNSIDNLSGKISSNAQSYILNGCVQPDYDAKDKNNTDELFAYHYCSPALENGNGVVGTSARTRMNDNYYYAKVEYSLGNYNTAYTLLGRSMHYMEDITSPPHSAIIRNNNTNNLHSRYETWVKDNWSDSYFLTNSSSSSTYNYMSTSSFQDIAINFATYSSSRKYCVYNFDSNSNKSLALTRECLFKAQRGVAGLCYRFLKDTGRL